MLDQDTLDFLSKTVYRLLPKEEYQAFVFGSWVTGKNRKYSDIDLGIEGSSEIPIHTLRRVRDSFEHSKLPYLVDIIDFSTVDENFKQEAKQNIVYL